MIRKTVEAPRKQSKIKLYLTYNHVIFRVYIPLLRTAICKSQRSVPVILLIRHWHPPFLKLPGCQAINQLMPIYYPSSAKQNKIVRFYSFLLSNKLTILYHFLPLSNIWHETFSKRVQFCFVIMFFVTWTFNYLVCLQKCSMRSNCKRHMWSGAI